MEYISIFLIGIILLVGLKVIYSINLKEIKKLTKNEKLDKLVEEKFPSNKEVCEEILKQLGNESVTVEESKDEKAETSLYIAVTNKIVLANIRKSYSRIQTIAHECVHSVQDRRVLLFNFIFSNIYILYFISLLLLTILQKIQNPMFHVAILSTLGLVYFSVRSMLETNAMTKAKYVAKEYMEEIEVTTKEEENEILQAYDEINKIGIKTVNYQILCNPICKIMLYSFLVWLLQVI